MLLDTDVLVALSNRLAARQEAATAWMRNTQAVLITLAPVLSETAFFLPARLGAALAGLRAQGAIQVHHPDAGGHARIAPLFAKYADQDSEGVDMGLIRLAEAPGVTRIATLDVADFSVYRVPGRKRFERVLLA